MPIEQNILYRLVLVKYLQGLSEQNFGIHSYTNAIAILHLHDAIELFYNASADYLGIVYPKKCEFDQYPKEIEKEKGIKLSNLSEISRLNKTRVAIKHHGTFPDPKDVAYYIQAGKGFLAEGFELIYGMDINEICVSEIINNSDAKLKVHESIKLAEKKFFKAACMKLDSAPRSGVSPDLRIRHRKQAS